MTPQIAKNESGPTSKSGHGSKSALIKWLVILVIAVIVIVFLWLAFFKKDEVKPSEHSATYVDDAGKEQFACALSPTTADAVRGWNPAHASTLKKSKCKSEVNSQCKRIAAGNARKVCKTELTACVCTK